MGMNGTSRQAPRPKIETFRFHSEDGSDHNTSKPARPPATSRATLYTPSFQHFLGRPRFHGPLSSFKLLEPLFFHQVLRGPCAEPRAQSASTSVPKSRAATAFITKVLAGHRGQSPGLSFSAQPASGGGRSVEEGWLQDPQPRVR